MYEDSWYSFVPDLQPKKSSSGPGHKRKESLLQQPNGIHAKQDSIGQLSELFEDDADLDTPSEPTLPRRAASFTDFKSASELHRARHGTPRQRSKVERNRERASRALMIALPGHGSTTDPAAAVALGEAEDEDLSEWLDEGLLEYSQREYLLYSDQLAMTERHLDSLIEDTNRALALLSSLSASFKAVEQQTSSFQAQCDDLVSEQKQLQKLADDVGSDLNYYAYLDNITRRVNAPGASRLVDDEAFGEILDSVDTCITFMTKNSSYRDAESYLSRYRSVLTRALHLLEQGFTSRLERVSNEVAKQIAATQSEASRYAIAYGRFQELLLASDALVPNVQTVVRKAFDQHGNPATAADSFDIYSNTANGMFQSYLAFRDRDLRPMVAHDAAQFRGDVKSTSAETAARNLVKQSLERAFEESALFAKIFAVTPHYSTDPASASALLRAHQRALVNISNVAPIAAILQSVLSATNLEALCNVVGWITNEYVIQEYDDEETEFSLLCRELAARLLTEHLWAYTDAAVEIEVAKSITKAPVAPENLKIGPVVNGVASSNAYPVVKRALELLSLFDQAMPKERCQKNSPVVYKLVRETISALQRAEARIKSLRGGASADPDLFMVKNLLILKNELVSLEIGNIRGGGGAASAARGQPGAGSGGLAGVVGSMQHFGAIWDAISPGAWIGYLGSFIWTPPPGAPPGSVPAGGGPPGKAAALPPTTTTPASSSANNPAEPDVSEQLDDLLRRSIYAFTARWGAQLSEARGGGARAGGAVVGGKNVARVERDLDALLQTAFGGQPEVVAKLKEAVDINAAAQAEAKAKAALAKPGKARR